MNDSMNLTYKKNMSKTEVLHVMAAVGLPLGLFCLSLMTISVFANYGTYLMCPVIGGMWVVGLVVAFLMPSMRREVINQTLITITTYCLAMLGLRLMLNLTSGVSSEMISASFNTPIPTATGNALPGYIQNIMFFTTAGVPIGFVGMQGKRLLQFKHNQSLQKRMASVRGIRKGGKGHVGPF